MSMASIDAVITSLPMHVRLKSAMHDGLKTVAELAAELDAKPDTVKKTLSRHNGRFFTCITNTKHGVHRWGNLERRIA